MTGAEAALALAVALVGGGHIWNWLASRGKTNVDLIELGQSIATATIKALQDDRTSLMGEVRELKAEIAALGVAIENLRNPPIVTMPVPWAAPTPEPAPVTPTETENTDA